jgi:hypothetical protein
VGFAAAVHSPHAAAIFAISICVKTRPATLSQGEDDWNICEQRVRLDLPADLVAIHVRYLHVHEHRIEASSIRSVYLVAGDAAVLGDRYARRRSSSAGRWKRKACNGLSSCAQRGSGWSNPAAAWMVAA